MCSALPIELSLQFPNNSRMKLHIAFTLILLGFSGNSFAKNGHGSEGREVRIGGCPSLQVADSIPIYRIPVGKAEPLVKVKVAEKFGYEVEARFPNTWTDSPESDEDPRGPHEIVMSPPDRKIRVGTDSLGDPEEFSAEIYLRLQEGAFTGKQFAHSEMLAREEKLSGGGDVLERFLMPKKLKFEGFSTVADGKYAIAPKKNVCRLSNAMHVFIEPDKKISLMAHASLFFSEKISKENQNLMATVVQIFDSFKIRKFNPK